MYVQHVHRFRLDPRAEFSRTTSATYKHDKLLRGVILHLSRFPQFGDQLWWHKSCNNVFAACGMRWRESILPDLHMLPRHRQTIVRWTFRRAALSIKQLGKLLPWLQR